LSTLILGTGFVGSVLVDWVRGRGIEVTQSSRSPGHGDVTVCDGAALDALVGSFEFEQIVVLGQLTGPDIDWVLERIDGSRWLVMSSQQVMSSVPAPGTAVALAREELALAKGACVLRPTMIFGRCRDLNITRLIAMMERWRVPFVPGSGDQMVQPLHVDDLCALVACHHLQTRGGLFAVGGAEALPLRELVGTLAELLGLRVPVVEVPRRAIDLSARFAPVLRLRPDQFKRLYEPRLADNGPVREAFNWNPEPLGLRLEQAVFDVNQRSGSGISLP
jgi:nucleoside-diphosphate-sugar epimerase